MGYEPTNAEVMKLLSDADIDGDGGVSFTEFYDMMVLKEAQKDPKVEILKGFKLFDTDSTGKISFENMKKVAREIGENMTDEEIQQVIDDVDTDGDRAIGQDEFIKMMKKVNLY